MNPSRPHPLPLLAALAAVACSEAPGERADAEAERAERREELRMQFASVQNQIRQVQGMALDSPGVKAAQEAFYQRLRTRMAEIDSSSLELLARAESVGHDLSRVTGSPLATPEEKQRVAAELAEVERLLRPIQDSAFRHPDVESSFQVLRDSVIATITRIDPSAERLLDRMREIERQIHELDRKGADGGPGWVPAPTPEAPGGTDG